MQLMRESLFCAAFKYYYNDNIEDNIVNGSWHTRPDSDWQ